MTTASADMPLNELGRNSSRSIHGTKNRTYEDFIMNSVADMFTEAIGDRTTGVLFRTFGILQPLIFVGDRMVRFQSLNDALDESFGNFADNIKKIILEKLYKDLQMKDQNNLEPNNFVSTLLKLEEHYKSR